MDGKAIINLLIGCGILTVIANRLFFRIDEHRSKKIQKDTVLKAAQQMQEDVATLKIQVAALTLLSLTESSPKDHKTIMYQADHYFNVLHGDSWVYSELAKWAEAEGVDISYLKEAHERNAQQKRFHGIRDDIIEMDDKFMKESKKRFGKK